MKTTYGFLIERSGKWHVGISSHAMIAAACLGSSQNEDQCRGYEWDPEHGTRVQDDHVPFPATALIVRAEEEASAFLSTAKGRRIAAENYVCGIEARKDAWEARYALCRAKLPAALQAKLVGMIEATKDAWEARDALCRAKLPAALQAKLVGVIEATKDAEAARYALCRAKLPPALRKRLQQVK